jgi:putative DNA primase/helicase
VFTNDDGSPDFATIDNIIQLGGYLLYNQIKMEKMFIFYGGGSNGKSILIDYIYKPFFPKQFTSSLSLNILSDDSSFNREPLIYSRVNFATEQKASDLESDELKKIITGEDVEILRKYNPKPLNHKTNTKLVVSGNRFMRFKDTSEGLRRRLMIFNFMNRFETNPMKYKKIVQPHKQRIFPAGNKDAMIEGLKEELPAILNTFLDGLRILRDNNWTFLESENNESVYKEYLNEADYLGTWLEETFVVDNDSTEYHTSKEILLMYKDWWEYNFPDKKFDTSTKLIGRRINDVFRVDSQKVNITINGNMSSAMSYAIKIRRDETWEMINNIQTTEPPKEEQQQMNF